MLQRIVISNGFHDLAAAKMIMDKNVRRSSGSKRNYGLLCFSGRLIHADTLNVSRGFNETAQHTA